MSERDEAQDQVREVLAAAADPGDEQIPEDLAARLDDVLADLSSERARTAADGAGSVAPDRGVGSVTALAGRRRRRWLQGLAAAAVVSVVGVGVGTVLGDSPEGESAMSTAESGAGTAADGADGEALGPEVAPRSQHQRPDVRVRLLAERPPRLRTGSLTVDVQRIEDFALAVPVAGTARELHRQCVRPTTRAGDSWLPVRLDGERGVLVLRAPAGERRTAEVYTCEDPGSPAAETTVVAR